MTSGGRSTDDASPVDLTDVLDAARDAAYVGIGLGVIAFQKAQVQRRAFEKRLRGESERP